MGFLVGVVWLLLGKVVRLEVFCSFWVVLVLCVIFIIYYVAQNLVLGNTFNAWNLLGFHKVLADLVQRIGLLLLLDKSGILLIMVLVPD